MRTDLYDRSAPRTGANLSINSDLLRRARELNVNLSLALEERLCAILREEQERQWREAHRGAVEDYKAFLDRHGHFGEEWRSF